MSDCGRNRFNEEEDFQDVLSKGNPGESSCQQNSRWLAHWTRASSSAYGKSCSPLEGADNSTCTKDYGTSLSELKKYSVAERLTLGGNYEGFSMKNVQQLNSNMWGVAHDVWQEAEQKRIERRNGSFQSSTVQMQRDESFYAKTVVSETLSVRRLPDLPLDFQKLVNSDENLDSHWNQLPMLSINQKVDSILNPKRRSATGTVFSDLFVPQQTPMLNVPPYNLMELSHQEYELQSLTTPSNLQSSYAKDSLYSGKPSGFGVCLSGPNINSHLFGAQKKFSPTTDKLHGDAQYVSKFSAGITSSLVQKDNGCAEEANEQLTTLSIKGSPGYNEESRSRVNQDISSKQDLCTPGAEIMDLDPLPFQPSSTRNQAPNSATQSPTRSDPCYRWLKRLRHDVSDDVRGPKRPRTGDCRPVGEASRKSSIGIADHVAEKSVHCWLGRWCRGGGAPVLHGDPDHRTRAGAKPDVAARELRVGGQFPSIKAMAMMGRVMSKVRPLDRQRKGPCVMWKTEGA